MRKLFLMILVIVGFVSCAKNTTETTGSIYGIVTVKETAEPMKATGVELYHFGSLLLKTVTYDDGHYEFENLSAGEYDLMVVASGYNNASYSVIVEAGRTARADMQLERLNTYMTVITLPATEISGDKATLNGTYYYRSPYSPQVIGFVYSTSPYPQNAGTTITCPLSSFSNVKSNLKKGKYYFQAYAKNSIGTEYGEILSFEIDGLPSVTTLDATNVTGTTATLNGTIDYEGDPAYTERGFVYSSSYSNPTADDPVTATTKVVVSGKSKEFSANIAGLRDNTSYYVRTYVTNGTGTVYGNAVEFSHRDYIILSSGGIMVHKYDITSGATWSAANSLCNNSKLGNFSDWRLPTTGECSILYKNKSQLTFVEGDGYWTSSNYSYVGHYYYNFKSGSSGYHCDDDDILRARCVRTLK